MFAVRAECGGCGHSGIYPATIPWPAASDGTDPCYRLPVFLSETIGTHLLWAYNRIHLDLLSDYVGAEMRERSLTPYYMTMMARLPRWMKLASMRPTVLHALTRLRARAERYGIR